MEEDGPAVTGEPRPLVPASTREELDDGNTVRSRRFQTEAADEQVHKLWKRSDNLNITRSTVY